LKSVQKKFKNSLTHDSRFVILRSHTETNISHMRTKTLLLTAALAAAGAATSMAQVYSVNMVGYINQSIPAGFTMIANHLNASPDNTIETLFNVASGIPDGTELYKFNQASGNYIYKIYAGGSWFGDPDTVTLNPGEGAWVNPPSAWTQTYVGEVPLTTSIPVPTGFKIYASALPQSLQLDTAPPAGLGFPLGDGDAIYRWNGTGFVYQIYAGGAWFGDTSTPPVPNIGESFWISRDAANPATSWNRTFTVGP
jgi:hypothetical protein